jgi:hypothetical protein
MDRSEASALADLQMHWDEAYVIGLDGNIWSATYRGSADELRAHTSSQLRELIRSDYSYRQRADLIAYDAEDDDEDGEHGEHGGTGADGDTEGAGLSEPGLGGGGTGADLDREQGDDDAASAGCAPVEIGNFAAIRGERMSI